MKDERRGLAAGQKWHPPMMKQKKSFVCALRAAVIFTLLPAGVNFVRAQAPATPPTDVPVKEVTLFSSGVGYFQHDGTVSGDGEARLSFKTAQINDILKSLILQDLDGGHVGVVTYPSQDPLDKTLASFQVNLGDNPSLGELLNKLRGARSPFPAPRSRPGRSWASKNGRFPAAEKASRRWKARFSTS